MSYNVAGRLKKVWGWNITKVVDAPRDAMMKVSSSDCRLGKKRDPAGCAIARSAVRGGWDAALVGRGITYLRKGKTAYRFRTGTRAKDELTDFDKPVGEFYPGSYALLKPGKLHRLGRKNVPHKPIKKRSGKRRIRSISSRPTRARV